MANKTLVQAFRRLDSKRRANLWDAHVRGVEFLCGGFANDYTWDGKG